MILKAYKYRLNPTKEQDTLIKKSIGSSRFIYNWALNVRIEKYKDDKKIISSFDLINTMKKELKDSEEYSWIKEVPAQGLQTSIRNLENAYKRFFKKQSKFPKFKKKRNGGSFTFPQGTSINFETKRIFLPV